MQDFHCKSGIQEEEKYFHQQIEQKFGEEVNEMIYYEHTFLLCWRRMEKII